MSDDASPLHLFEAYGIEIEYMIVDRETLAVRPISDEILKAATGAYQCDYEDGPVAWSNELVLHVIELKMNGPAPALAGWANRFSSDVRRIDGILREHGAMLLPGAMHPTFDPVTETKLWPHENGEIYATYDRIFGCRRHGWANLQSCHVNLPFQGDDEFARLHAAIRVVLPLLPALAASSPMMDGKVTGFLDNRLHVYLTHQARIPTAMGLVIPEPVFTKADYERRIFRPMFAEVAPIDSEGILQREFLNARGAIARFERDAIEIRLLDVQETPRADLGIALLVTAAVRALTEERWISLDALKSFSAESLAATLERAIASADATVLDEADFVAAFGLRAPVKAGDVWKHLAAVLPRDDGDWRELGGTIDEVLERGPLARRLRTRLGDAPASERIRDVYADLARCLVEDRLFRGA